MWRNRTTKVGKSLIYNCNVIKLYQYMGIRFHGDISDKPGIDMNNTVKLRWIKDGESNENEIITHVPVGVSILEAAHANDIDLEGACESSLACSTCHVILQDNIYDILNEPNDDEYDMLDLAYGLTETSRLGCQVIITKDMNDMVITLPKATRNMYVDGHKPTPH